MENQLVAATPTASAVSAAIAAAGNPAAATTLVDTHYLQDQPTIPHCE